MRCGQTAAGCTGDAAGREVTAWVVDDADVSGSVGMAQPVAKARSSGIESAARTRGDVMKKAVSVTDADGGRQPHSFHAGSLTG